MKVLRKFDITIFNLSNKEHDYEFEVNKEFFEVFESSPVSAGELVVKVTLDKSSSHIEVDFHIDGVIELTCDRSLDLFEYPINTEATMRYKYSDAYEELSEDLIKIPQNTQKLELAQIIYELICIEIPMKKLHPRFEEENDDDEEGTLIYQSEPAEDEEENKKETIDPRWAELNKLKK